MVISPTAHAPTAPLRTPDTSIAPNKATAQRIAYFGARKMANEGGYALERTSYANLFNVRKSADGLAYTVKLAYTTGLGKQVPASCNCAYYRKNSQFHICKHIYWVQWQVQGEADQAARDAEEDTYHIRITEEAEAQDFMEACRAEHLGGYGF